MYLSLRLHHPHANVLVPSNLTTYPQSEYDPRSKTSCRGHCRYHLRLQLPLRLQLVPVFVLTLTLLLHLLTFNLRLL